MALTSVNWLSSNEIPSRSFSGCTSLKALSISDTVTGFGSGALSNCPIFCLYWNSTIVRGGLNKDSFKTCCADGQFITDRSSIACSLCPAGTYASGIVFTCKTCPPGYTSGPGSSACDPCPLGTVALTSGSSSCTYWYESRFTLNLIITIHYSPAGTYANVTGSSTCTPCSKGKYSHVGASQCSSCSAT